MSNSALAPLMVGRQQQLNALHALLAQARAGQGQVVLLAGEAGVGKTRLLREFTRALEAAGGVAVYVGHCYDEAPASPYGPFVELLRSIGEAAEPAMGDLRRLTPALAPTGADRASGDPHAERRLLFQTIYQALRPQGEAARVLVLEDLHWADQASQDLLLYLARATEADPVLLIGSYRSDEMHRLHPLANLIARLTRDRRHHELRLAPLSRDELAEMLSATLGAAPPAELLAALYERTEGNPFFAEEVLGAILADGGPGSLGVGRAASLAPAIPLSIRESILRRADDLDEPTRAAMSAAAVIGRRFDFELLLRLTGMEEQALLRALSALVERQLIAEEPGGPEDRYRFRHELIRAALYEEMLRRERRLRHHEVLRALEELRSADPDAVVDQLAYHALMARALPEAARYSELAGDRAVRVHAYREALGHFEAALEAGEGRSDEAGRASLLARLGNAAYNVGEPRRAADYWREALPLYEAMGDRRSAADLRRWLGRCAWDVGDVAGAFVQTRAALEALEGGEPCRELAMAYSALSHLHMLQIGDGLEHIHESIVWGERALAMGEALGDEHVITHALNNVGVAMFEAGQISEGLQRLERSLATALRLDLPVDALRAYINLGGKLVQSGRRTEALALQRQGWAYAARHGYIRGSGKLLLSLCVSEFEAGEWDSAELRLAEALRPGFMGPIDDRPLLKIVQAMLLCGRAQYAEARELLEGLLATQRGDEPWTGAAHHLIDVYEALGEQARAVAVADALFARVCAPLAPGEPLTALRFKIFKLTGVVEVFLRVGRRDEALALLAAQEACAPTGEGQQVFRAYTSELNALAQIEQSPAAAAALLEGAIALYDADSFPLDAIRARWRLGEALLLVGGPQALAGAEEALRQARARAEHIGATHELRQIAAVEARLAPAPVAPARSQTAGQPRPVDGLTPRELEVLALVTRGLSNRAIAEALVISEKTAEVHVRNILGKLGFSSRTQAATYAVERGLVARTA